MPGVTKTLIFILIVLQIPAFAAETPVEQDIEPAAEREVPAEAYAHFGLAMHLFNARELSDALEALKQVTAIDPLAVQAYCYQGIIHRSRGELDEAEAALEKAVSIEPGSYRFRFEYGRVLLAQRRRDEGLQQWLRAAEDAKAAGESRFAELLYRQTAKSYLDAGDFDSAIEILLKAKEVSFEPEALADQIVGLYAKQGKWEDAVGIYREMLEDNPAAIELHLKIAACYEKAGDYGKAVGAYETYLDAAPDDIEEYTVLVTAIEAARNAEDFNKEKLFLQKSIDLLENLLASETVDVRVYSRLAALLGMAGETQRAIDIIKKGLETATGNQAVELNLMLANAYLDEAMPGDAEQALLSAMALNPANAGIRARLGTLYKNVMRFQDAADSFRRAAGLSPGRTRTAYTIALAEIHSEMGGYEQAEADLASILNEYPDEIYAWAALAKIRNAAGKYELAIPAAQRMLDIDSGGLMMKITGCLLIAEAYEKLDDQAAAEQAYQRLVEIARESDSGLAVAYLLYEMRCYRPAIDIVRLELDDSELRIHAMGLLAGLYRQSREIELAEQTCKQAIEEKPNEPEPYRYIADFYREQKSYEQALEAYSRALDLENDRDLIRSTQLGQADLYESMGDYERSEKLYKTLLEEYPDDPIVNNNYSYFLSNRERELDKALRMVRKSLQREPDSAAYADTYGWILYKMGRYEGALLKIYQAWQVQKDGEVGKHLGDVLFALDRKEQAVEIWHEALELDPENELLIQRLRNAGALQPAE